MSETSPPKSGLFVTNHLNMMFILALGFIPSPSGFGKKYYKDTLSEQPGWIPLFFHKRGKVPMSAIEMSTEEATHLIPVIIEISLEKLGCSARNADDAVQLSLFDPPVSTPKGKKAEAVRFVRAPISRTQIRRIYVESDAIREKVLNQVQLRNNVSLNPKVLRRRKTSFSGLKRWPWQPRDKRPEEDTPTHIAQVAGGILAMLYHVEKQGLVATQVVHEAACASDLCDSSVPGLSKWMSDAQVVARSKSVDGYLLWGLVKRIAGYWGENGGNDFDLDNIVLKFLERVPSEIQDQTKPICNTLRTLDGLGGATISEAFDLHESPLERALILFFMRREFQDLLELDNEKMSDVDWVYSAILFGARSGWLRLPLELRGEEEFRDKVCDRMTDFCHHLMKSAGPSD